MTKPEQPPSTAGSPGANASPGAAGAPTAAEHFRRPRNAGSLDRVDSLVGTGVAELPDRGDTIRIQVRIDPSLETVTEARFKAFGCVWIIACGSWITEWAQRRSLDELLTLESKTVAGGLDLPCDKGYCAELAVEALTAAVHDYRECGSVGAPGNR